MCHHQTQVECSMETPPPPRSLLPYDGPWKGGEKALAFRASLAFHGLMLGTAVS